MVALAFLGKQFILIASRIRPSGIERKYIPDRVPTSARIGDALNSAEV